MNTKSLSATQN